MRFLILTSVLACAAAAPSGALVGSLPVPAVATIAAVKTVPVNPIIPAIPIVKTIPTLTAIPVAAPTISPGDIQAAAINAKVEVEDYLRAAADKNREATEQALKDQADKIVEASNLASEKNQDAFWEVEDKKWQALTALQTAQAKLDGIVASNADLLGKAVIAPTAAVITQNAAVAPFVYSPVAIKTEEKKEENKDYKAEDIKEDSVQIESAANEVQTVKSGEAQFVALKTPAAVAENEQKVVAEAKLKEGAIVAPVLANLGFPLYAAPIAGVPVNLNEVGWQTTLLQPGVKIISPGVTLTQEGVVDAKTSW
ncbi:pupal cuticle protein PCP52-like [Plodia interpunctella]|uniref:pupal cuticle protein PCP52-like n=1 Tax=Plodia interpunctella TaxID=58824 RepID=UPI002368324C|nr:pupal cuticle protein PCP52-like [Plodia interpunctella]